MAMSAVEPIPISLVCQWMYCPRRAWLEAAGERSDSYQMEAGFTAHKSVDDSSSERKAKGETRALEVSCTSLGVVGKLDSVEQVGDAYEIVEYKATPVKKTPEVTDAMRVQLALQKRCLEDGGYSVASTAVFFTSHHRRVEIELGPDDFDMAENAVRETRAVVMGDSAPLPLEDSHRCNRCSHADICLPEERHLGAVQRSIRVADPDSQVVHLSTPGSFARCSKGKMVVTKGDETLAKIPLETVQALELHGNVNLSGGLTRELLWRNVPILWCSGSGKLVGWAVSSYGPNGLARNAQHIASAEGRLSFAREFVASKIANQATQLRRTGQAGEAVEKMRLLQKQVSDVGRWQDILGIEGEAAAIYFTNWHLLVKEGKREVWPWHGRSGRPATDAINALLNYAYALLLADTVKAITACGLDPHAGFLHSANRNKPALALDLMEEFRAPVADSVVQTVINNGEVAPESFSAAMGSIRMKAGARKALIAAYERRMETQIRHPIFGYPAKWRRTLEIQARQILGVLDGSQDRYQGIRIR